MSKLEYIINPVLMGGLVKEADDKTVKVHLHGRLGVITVPRAGILSDMPVVPGTEMQFYFSYLEVTNTPYEYDTLPIRCGMQEPCFIGGTICEVNDTAIKADIVDHLGTVAVPRRWVFAQSTLEEGQNVEFYFSPMRAVGKRNQYAGGKQ
jgi:hypothetical protein